MICHMKCETMTQVIVSPLSRFERTAILNADIDEFFVPVVSDELKHALGGGGI